MNISILQNSTNGTKKIPANLFNDIIAYMEIYHRRKHKDIWISQLRTERYELANQIVHQKKPITQFPELDDFHPEMVTVPNTPSPRIAVHFTNYEELKKFFEELQFNNIKPQRGVGHYWKLYENNLDLCISLNNGFAYGAKWFYERTNYQIITPADLN